MKSGRGFLGFLVFPGGGIFVSLFSDDFFVPLFFAFFQIAFVQSCV